MPPEDVDAYESSKNEPSANIVMRRYGNDSSHKKNEQCDEVYIQKRQNMV